MFNSSNFSVAIPGNVTFDENLILQQLNNDEAFLLLPVTAYVLALMVVGIFGNLLVLYIYKFRFRRSSSRAFILCLAMLDLVTCIFGIPFHIMDINFPYLFVWDIPCKVLCYFLTSTIFSAVFVLVLISIERYRKICLPFEKQISDIGTKRICTGCIVAAVILSSPALLFYGVSTFDTKVMNVTGTECYINDNYKDSIFPLIFDGVFLLIFLVSTCTLTVLYTKIGLTVWRKGTFQGNKKTAYSMSCCEQSVTTEPFNKSSQSEKMIEMTAINSRKQRIDPNGPLKNTFDEYSNVLINSPKLGFQSENKNKRLNLQLKKPQKRLHSKRESEKALSSQSRKSISEDSSSESFSSTLERRSHAVRQTLRFANKLSRKQRRSIRITGMLTVITIVFILSFLPYLVISILNGFDERFWENRTPREILLLNILMRSYFVNNMANPIIYSFLDEKFRSEVRKIFRCFYCV